MGRDWGFILVGEMLLLPVVGFLRRIVLGVGG